jgi:hypothetical protein
VSASLVAALLAACGGGPPPTDWSQRTRGALANLEGAYFAGNTRVAEIEIARARREVAATGAPGLAARVELTYCALRATGLEFDDCPGLTRFLPDLPAAERAYAAYLQGQWTGLDAGQLPLAQRAVPARGAEAVSAIEDPLSRLVAAGVVFRTGRASPAIIATAIDTAAAQGWRRPLLAWLAVEERRLAGAGDGEGAARVRRRIELVSRP